VRVTWIRVSANARSPTRLSPRNLKGMSRMNVSAGWAKVTVESAMVQEPVRSASNAGFVEVAGAWACPEVLPSEVSTTLKLAPLASSSRGAPAVVVTNLVALYDPAGDLDRDESSQPSAARTATRTKLLAARPSDILLINVIETPSSWRASESDEIHHEFSRFGRASQEARGACHGPGLKKWFKLVVAEVGASSQVRL